jgi:carotenoid cleavage dioxygenase-like enzyme
VSDHSYSRRKIASIPVMEPGYIHSFGLTQRYVVLVEFPIKFNPIRLFIGRPRPLFKYYRWEPERGTRFFVVDRDSGKVVRRAETDGFFAFHHVNAFEDGDDVVVDLVVHERGPGAIWAAKTDRMRESNSPASNEERLHRYRVSLSTGAVRGGRLSDASLELPRINYARNNTRDYRYVYGVGRATSESDFYDQVVKLDVEGGDTASWSDDGCYAGEPIFVARPGAAREDDGVLLSVVLDTNARRSFLLALDARTGDELARAQAPHHIPFGFHGDYFS